MPKRLSALRANRRLSLLAVVWVCASFLFLAYTEWRVWNVASVTPVSPPTMGTMLFSGVGSLLVVQVIALLVFGLASRGWKLELPGLQKPALFEIILLVGITLVALGVRLAALQDIPYGLWFDTAEDGNQAIRMLQNPSYRPVFIAEATQLPALFVYFDAFSINFLGNEALAVRLPAALFGAATVPALWWFGRQLGGPVLGLAAAFALATSRWHIDFSRLALASIVSPLSLTLALAATLAALRAKTHTARITLAILAGLAVSLGLWSYPASLLVAPVLAGGIAWWVVRGRLRAWQPRLVRGAIVLAIAGVSCASSLGPLLQLSIENPDMVFQRTQAVAVTGDASQAVFESAIQHVLMFTVRGDRNGRHNTPGRPELGLFAPLFLAGVGAAIWRAGSGISLAVPAALLFLASGILTLPFEAPQSHRAILSVVPAALLIALPVALAWWRSRVLALPLIGALVVAGVVEPSDYFRAQQQDPSVYLENSLLETEAGRWLHTLGPNVPILSGERFRGHPTVRYLSGDHTSIATPGTAISEFLPLDGTQSVALLSAFDETALFDRARTLYAQAPVQTFGAPLGQGEPLVWAMWIPRDVQQQTLGFRAELPNGTAAPVPSLDAVNALAWSATMKIQTSGDYRVNGGGGGVAIDGETVLPAGQPAVTLFLARGAHAVRITRATNVSPGFTMELVQAAPSAQGAAPPPSTEAVQFYALEPPGGLLFTWQIEGRPLQALVDSAPHRGFEGTFNDGRPWTAQWRGRLRADQPGDYGFRLEAISTAVLFIDDQPVIRGDGEGHANLQAGMHAIRVEYVDRDPYARLFLNWRPPGGGDFGPIPDVLLTPALQLP